MSGAFAFGQLWTSRALVVASASTAWAGDQTTVNVNANVAAEGAVQIGTILVDEDQPPAGSGFLMADFTLKPEYKKLDEWFNFQWVNIELSYTVNGVAIDADNDGNPDDPVLGELPAIDPQPSGAVPPPPAAFADNRPFYWTNAQFQNQHVEGASSHFEDSRSDNAVGTAVITFRTYLVAENLTDHGLGVKKICILAGFEWTSTIVNGGDSAEAVTMAIPAPGVAEQNQVTTALGNSEIPDGMGGVDPGFPGWTAMVNCHLNYCPPPAQVLFSSVLGDPSADVPGLPGVHFTGTAPFDRPFGTPNGHWIMSADTDAATTADDVLLVDGLVALREGDPVPWELGTATVGPFDVRNGINANGHYALGNNTTAAANDDYIVRFNGSWTVMAQEAGPVGAFGGAVTYDDTIDSTILLANGDVAIQADLVDGAVTTTTDEIFVIEGLAPSVIAQENVTVPLNPIAGGSESIEDIDFEDVWFTPDGLHYVLKGNLTGLTTQDNVVIHDGVVVLQEGFEIPSGPFVLDPIDTSGIVEVAMDAAGNWWARGNNESETDWVVRNGVVMAKVGDPIVSGASELWDDAIFSDCFFMHQGDSTGNFVIGGVTDHANVLTNGVLVLNNSTVLVREGDPIDVDGDGLFDDDAYFNTFGNDDLVLNDFGELMFVATIRDGAGVQYAQGLFKYVAIDPPENYCTSGVTTNGCLPSIWSDGYPSVSKGGKHRIHVAQVEGQKQGLIFYGVSGPLASPWGTGSSFLCVKAPTQRTGAQNAGGTLGECDGEFVLDWGAYIALNLGALGNPFGAGATVNAQGWFRDPPSPKTTNLSNGLQFTTVP